MTDLDPRIRAELERRGVESIRLLIASHHWVGAGAQAPVEIGGDLPNPTRAEVEHWLQEQAQAESRLVQRRHRQVMGWAIAATIAGIVGVLVAILQWLSSR